MTTEVKKQLSLYEQLRQLPFGWRKEIATKIGVHYNSVYNTLVLGMNGKNSPAIIAEAKALVKEWEMKKEETTAKRLEKLKADFEASKAALEEAMDEHLKLTSASATA